MPFVIMNERLLNNPVPPREIDPSISPQLQEIIYRAMERDPKNRYPNAHEFAWDLEHQDQVGVAADRAELHDWKQAPFAFGKANSVSMSCWLDSYRDLHPAALLVARHK